MRSWVLCIVFDLLGISGLQVGRTRGLHVDQTTAALSVSQGLIAVGIDKIHLLKFDIALHRRRIDTAYHFDLAIIF